MDHYTKEASKSTFVLIMAAGYLPVYASCSDLPWKSLGSNYFIHVIFEVDASCMLCSFV
jgi:hypothetical protein